MLRYGQEYVDAGAEYYERQYQQRALSAARRRAAQLGYRLVPMPYAPEHTHLRTSWRADCLVTTVVSEEASLLPGGFLFQNHYPSTQPTSF